MEHIPTNHMSTKYLGEVFLDSILYYMQISEKFTFFPVHKKVSFLFLLWVAGRSAARTAVLRTATAELSSGHSPSGQKVTSAAIII